MKGLHNSEVKRTAPLRYAIGMLGTSIPIKMFKTYAAIFYIGTFGITTIEFAKILAIYTVVDIVDNVIYGFLSDRTRSPWGRRRPWIVIGTPLLAVSLVLFFNPIGAAAQDSVYWYMLLMYFLTGTLDSLVNSNYNALFPELFHTESLRARANMFRQIFQLMAMIIGVVLTPLITELLGYSITSVLYGILVFSVILFMSFGCHEDLSAQTKPKPELLKSIREIFANPKVWIYGAVSTLFLAGQEVLLVSIPFYIKYTLNLDGKAVALMQGIVIAVSITCIPLWVKIYKKITLISAWRLALMVTSAGFVPLCFADSFLLSTASLAVFGFGAAGVMATMDIVNARILDEDTAHYRIQREGFFYSISGSLNKTSGLVQSLAFLLVFQLFAFESGNNPGSQPDTAAHFLTAVFPFCAFLLCTCVSFALKFTNQNERAVMDYTNTSLFFLREDCKKSFGHENGTRIYDQACEQFVSMLADADYRNNKSIKKHIVIYMFPAIAYYLTLQVNGYSKDEAYTLTLNETQKAAHIHKKRYEVLAKLPFAFEIFKLFIKGVMKKSYPGEGWDAEWIQFGNKEIQINFKRCIYLELTAQLGCPELCTVFCKNDNVTLAGFEPKIRFKRSGTLAEGSPCCDFHFIRSK
jgi:GPH family glycoside/pentoside/hexuronide:cation symporter